MAEKDIGERQLNELAKEYSDKLFDKLRESFGREEGGADGPKVKPYVRRKIRICPNMIRSGQCHLGRCNFAHYYLELQPLRCRSGARCEVLDCKFFHPDESKVGFCQRTHQKIFFGRKRGPEDARGFSTEETVWPRPEEDRPDRWGGGASPPRKVQRVRGAGGRPDEPEHWTAAGRPSPADYWSFDEEFWQRAQYDHHRNSISARIPRELAHQALASALQYEIHSVYLSFD